METKGNGTPNAELNRKTTRPATSTVKNTKKEKRLRTPGLIVKNRKLQRPKTVAGKVRDLGDYHGAASDWTIALRQTGSPNQSTRPVLLKLTTTIASELASISFEDGVRNVFRKIGLENRCSVLLSMPS